MRKTMVETDHPQLSVRQQCELLGVNRNRLTPKERQIWEPKRRHAEMLELIPLIHAKDPTMGNAPAQESAMEKRVSSDQMDGREDDGVSGNQSDLLQAANDGAGAGYLKYPYLLRNREITEPDEVWAIDITYIPWRRGHVYLTDGDHRLEDEGGFVLESV